jgi:hypothetical protein
MQQGRPRGDRTLWIKALPNIFLARDKRDFLAAKERPASSGTSWTSLHCIDESQPRFADWAVDRKLLAVSALHFEACIKLFHILGMVCNATLLPGITVRSLHGSLAVRTLPSKNHQRRIDCYGSEPGRKVCPAIERFQMQIGVYPRIRNHVLCVLSLPRDPIERLEPSIRVPPP